MSSNSALSNPLYRRYFIASAFATLGVWMTRFLLGWLIWLTTESFFWVGVASTSLLLPSLFVTPVFGVISDRINLRMGVVMWLLIQAIVTLLCWLVFHYYSEALAPLLVMTLLFGIVASAGSPLRLTLIPQLVKKEELPNAVGLGAMLFNSARIVAPATGAAFLNLMSSDAVFLLCTALFAIAMVINFGLPNIKSDNEPRSQKTTGWQDFVQGAQYCWHMPMIRLMFVLTLINSQVGRSFMELLPALSGTFGSGGPEGLALLTGSAGAGSIIGGWIISRQRGSTQSMIRLLTFAMGGTAVLLIPLFMRLPIVLVAILVGGISGLMTVLGTGMQIVLQLRSDNAKRGRVMSLWLTIALVGPALGALIMGSLAEWLGITAMLTVMTAISLMSALWLKTQKTVT